MLNLLFVITGFIAGIASGLLGIGGGIIIIPILIYCFGFSQHMAQGTTLALMVPPIGILAAYTYYKSGHVNISIALCICAGFVIGGLIGARFVVGINDVVLRKVFGISMFLISIHMILK